MKKPIWLWLVQWATKTRRPLWSWIGTGKYSWLDIYWLFEPRDLWFGVYWTHEHLYMLDGKNSQHHLFRIYVCLIPTLPLLIKFLKEVPVNA